MLRRIRNRAIVATLAMAAIAGSACSLEAAASCAAMATKMAKCCRLMGVDRIGEPREDCCKLLELEQREPLTTDAQPELAAAPSVRIPFAPVVTMAARSADLFLRGVERLPDKPPPSDTVVLRI